MPYLKLQTYPEFKNDPEMKDMRIFLGTDDGDKISWKMDGTIKKQENGKFKINSLHFLFDELLDNPEDFYSLIANKKIIFTP